mmetsp:Transcript_111620/g.204737  ORF Transcript_111620/g.204737 Transcript_111620/m.204737 type:complete len:312 (+) Transcript_111620:1-936(+)
MLGMRCKASKRLEDFDSVIDPAACMQLCNARGGCNSFDFKVNTQQCELCSAYDDENDLTANSDWEHSWKSNACGLPLGSTSTTTFAPTTTTTEVLTTTTTTAKEGVCSLHEDLLEYSLVTLFNATVAAHDIYGKMAIGDSLFDGSPQESSAVRGMVTYSGVATGNWRFNGGSRQVPKLPFDWGDFEWLARNAVDASYMFGFKVKVFTDGGSYNTYDVNPGGQGEDNGKTLMIFNTWKPVFLTKTSDGRQFGPSVLAPFSTVTLSGNAGFIDGCVIAKRFGDSLKYQVGGNGGQLQMHGSMGNCYYGPITCK